MLHSEQIVKLDSPFRVTTDKDGQSMLVNTSSFPLNGTTLLRRTGLGRIEAAWLGFLAAGESKPIKWTPTDGEQAFENWSEEISTQRTKPEEQELSGMQGIWIGGLLHQIGMRTPLVDGQTRLIGYTDKTLGGLQISPNQDQYDKVCVVVSHLTPATLGPVLPDPIVAGREFNPDPLPKNDADSNGL